MELFQKVRTWVNSFRSWQRSIQECEKKQEKRDRQYLSERVGRTLRRESHTDARLVLVQMHQSRAQSRQVPSESDDVSEALLLVHTMSQLVDDAVTLARVITYSAGLKQQEPLQEPASESSEQMPLSFGIGSNDGRDGAGGPWHK